MPFTAPDLYAFLVAEATLPEASLRLDDEVEIFFALILDQYCPVEVLVKIKRLLEQVETSTYELSVATHSEYHLYRWLHFRTIYLC